MTINEPISLDEAKNHLRIDHDADDSYINALITAAREYVESYQNRRIAVRCYNPEEAQGEPWEECGAMEKHAMLLLIGHWYSQREAVSAQSLHDIPVGVDNLLWFNRDVAGAIGIPHAQGY